MFYRERHNPNTLIKSDVPQGGYLYRYDGLNSPKMFVFKVTKKVQYQLTVTKKIEFKSTYYKKKKKTILLKTFREKYVYIRLIDAKTHRLLHKTRM